MAGERMRRRADRHRRTCATTFHGRRHFVVNDEFGAPELDHRSTDNGQLEMPRIGNEPAFLSVQSDFLPEPPLCCSISRSPLHAPYLTCLAYVILTSRIERMHVNTRYRAADAPTPPLPRIS